MFEKITKTPNWQLLLHHPTRRIINKTMLLRKQYLIIDKRFEKLRFLFHTSPTVEPISYLSNGRATSGPLRFLSLRRLICRIPLSIGRPFGPSVPWGPYLSNSKKNQKERRKAIRNEVSQTSTAFSWWEPHLHLIIITSTYHLYLFIFIRLITLLRTFI